MNRRKLTLPLAGAAIMLCIVLAEVFAGVPGAVGAAIGGVIVVAFFGSTPAMLGPIAKTSPGLSLLFAMIFFLTKVVALVALFFVLSRAVESGSQIDPKSVSLTVIAVTMVWLVAKLVDATRDRTPIYDLD